MGLAIILQSDIDLADILIKPGQIDHLVMLPGGTPIMNSTEMLGSPKMCSLAQELKDRYPKRIIIFDLPPVLSTADTLSFVPCVDCALIVVEDDTTKEAELKQTIDLLSVTNIIGTVLNKAKYYRLKINMDHLITPYKGELVNLLLDESDAEHVKIESESYPAITLTQRQQCDLELLVTGALSPLTGFMNQKEYESVIDNTTLTDGTVWPIPYYFDLTEEQAESINVGDIIALRDIEGFMPAVMIVESKWQPDKTKEAENIYGTTDTEHPGVDYLMNTVGDVYIGGRVDAVQLPFNYDFETLRFTPAELRQHFEKLGWRSIVAFHTSKPMHAVHYEMTMRASKQANAHILIHPVVGMAKPGDLHYYSRVHCYEAILKQYPKSLVSLALIPMAMRMAGPREALMNAIIRQNYGCTHYIVGTEHAGPPNVRDSGKRFYATGASQQYVEQYKDDIDIEIINIEELCYDEDKEKFVTRTSSKQALCSSESFSNTRILNSLLKQEEVPEWVTFPEVLKVLRKAYPSRSEQGLTLFFTGLSGSGKSTIARIIYAKFIEEGNRAVTLLDGDVVRLNLSSELGFSRKDRTNQCQPNCLCGQ